MWLDNVSFFLYIYFLTQTLEDANFNCLNRVCSNERIFFFLCISANFSGYRCECNRWHARIISDFKRELYFILSAWHGNKQKNKSTGNGTDDMRGSFFCGRRYSGWNSKRTIYKEIRRGRLFFFIFFATVADVQKETWNFQNLSWEKSAILFADVSQINTDTSLWFCAFLFFSHSICFSCILMAIFLIPSSLKPVKQSVLPW